ncbi:MAG: 2Fe-2S iron-sulfur cluster binding domain-containing protein, partial [Gammaproteobacteria bacterium]|nr:2Fe-2S iron-sulfur cluster binding domain-containing protein [Gammaproteobacteria bacterium]
MSKHKIRFLPAKKEFLVRHGHSLLSFLQQLKIEIPHSCSGKGICGKCKIRLIIDSKKKKFKDQLACQIKITGPLTIHHPLLPYKNLFLKVLKDANIKSRFKRAPLVERVNFDSGLSLILDNYELLTVEKRSNRHVLGIAVDVGTTTICVSLCDLTNGEELATSTLLNMQSEYGADIISRLDFALKSQKNARRLNERVIFSINKAIDECAQKAGVGVHRIFSAVMVGNSAMQHLLLQLPLKSLISPPYRIALQGIVQMKAKSLKLNINPNANIRFL